jgi:hypothetical protein
MRIAPTIARPATSVLRRRDTTKVIAVAISTSSSVKAA